MKNPILPKYTEIKINSKDKKFWVQANIEQVRRLPTKIQCGKKIHEFKNFGDICQCPGDNCHQFKNIVVYI